MLGQWLQDLESLEAISQDDDAKRIFLRMAAISQTGGMSTFLTELAEDLVSRHGCTSAQTTPPSAVAGPSASTRRTRNASGDARSFVFACRSCAMSVAPRVGTVWLLYGAARPPFLPPSRREERSG